MQTGNDEELEELGAEDLEWGGEDEWQNQCSNTGSTTHSTNSWEEVDVPANEPSRSILTLPREQCWAQPNVPSTELYVARRSEMQHEHADEIAWSTKKLWMSGHVVAIRERLVEQNMYHCAIMNKLGYSSTTRLCLEQDYSVYTGLDEMSFPTTRIDNWVVLDRQLKVESISAPVNSAPIII